MMESTASKLQVILNMNRVSLKEIRTWEREKIRRRIFDVALKKYWLFEQVIRDANLKWPKRMVAYYSN